jgi:hypothetical protein
MAFGGRSAKKVQADEKTRARISKGTSANIRPNIGANLVLNIGANTGAEEICSNVVLGRMA